MKAFGRKEYKILYSVPSRAKRASTTNHATLTGHILSAHSSTGLWSVRAASLRYVPFEQAGLEGRDVVAGGVT